MANSRLGRFFETSRADQRLGRVDLADPEDSGRAMIEDALGETENAPFISPAAAARSSQPEPGTLDSSNRRIAFAPRGRELLCRRAMFIDSRRAGSVSSRCDGSPTDEFQGINREHGADDPEGAEAVAAPATVSGEPVASTDHWETGKVGIRQRPASQETCHREAVTQGSGGADQ